MSKISSFNRSFYSNWSCDLRETRLQKMIKLILAEPPGKMLDIGCSSGEFCSGFINFGWEVHGIDISEEQAAKARKKRVAVKTGDIAQGLPYEDKTFDLIIAGEIIEHLIDTDYFLQEVHRILKLDGVLILTTPNLASFENRLRILFGRYPIWVDYRVGGSGHVRAYTPRALKKQLLEHGFEIEKHIGNFVPPISQLFLNDIQAPWLKYTGDIFPNLATDIMIKARKAGAEKL